MKINFTVDIPLIYVNDNIYQIDINALNAMRNFDEANFDPSLIKIENTSYLGDLNLHSNINGNYIQNTSNSKFNTINSNQEFIESYQHDVQNDSKNYLNSHLNSNTKETFKKITTTETITKRIIQKRRSSGQQDLKFENDEEFRKFVDNVNAEYNDLVNRYNLLADENAELKNKLKNNLIDLDRDSKTLGSQIEGKEYFLLKKEFENYKQNSHNQMEEFKLKFKEEHMSLNSHLLNEEIKNLKFALQEREDKIQILNKKANQHEMDKQNKDEIIYKLKNELDEKYEHFEELNKYINDLLKEKKAKIYEIEQKNQELKEVKLSFKGINPNTAPNMNTTTTTNNTVTTTTTTRRLVKKKRKPKTATPELSLNENEKEMANENDQLVNDYNNLADDFEKLGIDNENLKKELIRLKNSLNEQQTNEKEISNFTIRQEINSQRFSDYDYLNLKDKFDDLQNRYNLLQSQRNGDALIIRQHLNDEGLADKYMDLQNQYQMLLLKSQQNSFSNDPNINKDLLNKYNDLQNQYQMLLLKSQQNSFSNDPNINKELLNKYNDLQNQYQMLLLKSQQNSFSNDPNINKELLDKYNDLQNQYQMLLLKSQQNSFSNDPNINKELLDKYNDLQNQYQMLLLKSQQNSFSNDPNINKELLDKYNDLQNQYQMLLLKYNKNNTSTVTTNIIKLEGGENDKYNKELFNKFNELQNQYNILVSKYNNQDKILNNYNNLQNEYGTLKYQYESSLNNNSNEKEKYLMNEVENLRKQLNEKNLNREFKESTPRNDFSSVDLKDYEQLQDKFNRLNFSYNELLLAKNKINDEFVVKNNLIPDQEVFNFYNAQKKIDKKNQILILTKQIDEISQKETPENKKKLLALQQLVETNKNEIYEDLDFQGIRDNVSKIETVTSPLNSNKLEALKLQLKYFELKYSKQNTLNIKEKNEMQIMAFNKQNEILVDTLKDENKLVLIQLQKKINQLESQDISTRIFEIKGIKEDMENLEKRIPMENKQKMEIIKLQVNNIEINNNPNYSNIESYPEFQKKKQLQSLQKQVEFLIDNSGTQNQQRTIQLKRIKTELKNLEFQNLSNSKNDIEKIISDLDNTKKDSGFEEKSQIEVIQMQLRAFRDKNENDNKIEKIQQQITKIETQTKAPTPDQLKNVNIQLEDFKKVNLQPVEKVTFSHMVKQTAPKNALLEAPKLAPSEFDDSEIKALTKELDRAYDQIEKLQKNNELLNIELEGKKKEIITVTKEVKIKETDTITKNNDLNTHTTKVIKLQAKERIKEWQIVHDSSQNLAKNLKQLLEQISDEKIHDNLDLEIKEKNGLGYSEPVINYLDKSLKYQRQLNLIIEENKGKDEKILKLQKDLKQAKEEQNLSDFVDIFQESKKSTHFYIELLKAAQQEKFINTKDLDIQSEDPKIYLQAIFENFHSHEEYYKQIKDLLDSKNKELKRLEEFEKSIISGKNKNNAMEDYMNILEKNKKVNLELTKLANSITEEETYKPLNIETPSSPQICLENISDQFLFTNKMIKEINRNIEDLSDENNELKKKLKAFGEKNNNEELKNLEDLYNSAKSVNAQSKETLRIVVPDLVIKTVDIDVKDKNFNPNIFKISVENYHKSIKDDLLRIMANVNEQKDELEKLREIEKQAKLGKMNDNSINDLNFLLKKNVKLNDNIKECYKNLTKESAEEIKFNVSDENDPESYINALGKSIKQSNSLVLEMDGIVKEQRGEIERLHIFEKEIIEGKNKDFSKEDFISLEDKSKKNLKEIWAIIGKLNPQKDNWKSTIFSAEQNSEQYLEATHQNLNKWHNCNRELQDLLNDLIQENSRLKQFEEDIKSGKNKKYSLVDLKNNYEEAKIINKELIMSFDKLATRKPTNMLEINISEGSPETYLEATKKTNNNTKAVINELNDEIRNLNRKSEELVKFEQNVKNGKIKIGCEKDFEKIYESEKIEAKKINSLIAKVHLDPKNEDFNFESAKPKTSEDFIRELEKLEDYEKKKLKNLEFCLENMLEEKKQDKTELEKLKIYKKEVESGMNKIGAFKDLEEIYNKNLVSCKSNKNNLEMLDDNEKKNLLPFESEKFETPEEYIQMIKSQFDYHDDLNQKLKGKLEKNKETNEMDKKKLNDLLKKQGSELETLKKFEQDVMTGKNKIGAKADLVAIYDDEIKNSKYIKETLELLNPLEQQTPFPFQDQKPENPEHYIKYINEMNQYQNNSIEKIKNKLKEDKLNSTLELNKLKGTNDDINKELARLRNFEEEVLNGKNKIGAKSDLAIFFKNNMENGKMIKNLLEINDPAEKQNKFPFEGKSADTPEEYIKLITDINQYQSECMKKLIKDNDKLKADLLEICKYEVLNSKAVKTAYEGVNILEKNKILPFDDKKKPESVEESLKYIKEMNKYQNDTLLILTKENEKFLSNDLTDIYNKDLENCKTAKKAYELVNLDEKQNKFSFDELKKPETKEEIVKLICTMNNYQNEIISKLNSNNEKIIQNDLNNLYQLNLRKCNKVKSGLEEINPEQKEVKLNFDQKKPQTPQDYLKLINEMNQYQKENEKISNMESDKMLKNDLMNIYLKNLENCKKVKRNAELFNPTEKENKLPFNQNIEHLNGDELIDLINQMNSYQNGLLDKINKNNEELLRDDLIGIFVKDLEGCKNAKRALEAINPGEKQNKLPFDENKKPEKLIPEELTKSIKEMNAYQNDQISKLEKENEKLLKDDLNKIYLKNLEACKNAKKALEASNPAEKTNQLPFDENKKPDTKEDYLKLFNEMNAYQNDQISKLEKENEKLLKDDLNKIYLKNLEACKNAKKALEASNPAEKTNQLPFDENKKPDTKEDYLKLFNEMNAYQNDQISKLEKENEKLLKDDLNKIYLKNLEACKNAKKALEASNPAEKTNQLPFDENKKPDTKEDYLKLFNEMNAYQNNIVNKIKEDSNIMIKDLKRLKTFENDVLSGNNKTGAKNDFISIYNVELKNSKNIKEVAEILYSEEKQTPFPFAYQKPETPEQHLKYINEMNQYQYSLIDMIKLKINETTLLSKSELFKQDSDNAKKNKEYEEILKELNKLRQFEQDVLTGKNKIGAKEEIIKIYQNEIKNSLYIKQNIIELLYPEEKQRPFLFQNQKPDTPDHYIKYINEMNQYQQEVMEKVNKKLIENALKTKTEIENLEKEKQNLNNNNEALKKELDKMKQFEKDVLSGVNKIGGKNDFIAIYNYELKNAKLVKEVIELTNSSETKNPFPFQDQKPDTPEHYIKYINEMNQYQNSSIEKIKLTISQNVLLNKEEALKQNIENEKRNQDLTRLKKLEDDVKTGKNKEGAAEDLKNIYKANFENARKMRDLLSDDPEVAKHKFSFEGGPEFASPEDYIRYIEEMNKFQRDYIEKLKKRIEDLLNEARDSREKIKNLMLEKAEIDLERRNLQEELDRLRKLYTALEIQLSTESEERMKMTLKQKEFELQISSQSSQMISSAKFQEILRVQIETRKEVNFLTSLISNTVVIDDFNYNLNEMDNQKLFEYINENTKKINQKVNDLKPLLKNYSSTDTMLVLNILKELESFKQRYLEMYELLVDNDLDDTSDVDLKNAKDSDITIKFIYQDLKFLNESLEIFQDDVEDKINVVVSAKNKILQEKEKLQYLSDDLTKENNKKAALIGKLQVKLYVLMTVLENLENLKNA